MIVLPTARLGSAVRVEPASTDETARHARLMPQHHSTARLVKPRCLLATPRCTGGGLANGAQDTGRVPRQSGLAPRLRLGAEVPASGGVAVDGSSATGWGCRNASAERRP